MCGAAAHLVDGVFPSVPLRQWAPPLTDNTLHVDDDHDDDDDDDETEGEDLEEEANA